MTEDEQLECGVDDGKLRPVVVAIIVIAILAGLAGMAYIVSLII